MQPLSLPSRPALRQVMGKEWHGWCEWFAKAWLCWISSCNFKELPDDFSASLYFCLKWSLSINCTLGILILAWQADMCKQIAYPSCSYSLHKSSAFSGAHAAAIFGACTACALHLCLSDAIMPFACRLYLCLTFPGPSTCGLHPCLTPPGMPA